MDQETYREAITRTWNDEPPRQYQPANAALGIVGEVYEYGDERTPDELGDLLHYVTTLRRLLEFPVVEPDDQTRFTGENIDEMRLLASETAELTKKCVFHGDKPGDRLEALTAELLAIIGREAEHRLKTSLEEVRRQNIDKLKARYPEGFEA